MTCLSLTDVGISAVLAGPVQRDLLLSRFLVDQYSLVPSWADLVVFQELAPCGVNDTPASVIRAERGFDVRAPGDFRILLDMDVAYLI